MARRVPSNGLIFTALYLPLMLLAWLLMRQPPVTGEFPEKVARRFNVVQVTGNTQRATHRSISLWSLRDGAAAGSDVRYRLQVPELELHEGDVSRVRVVEDHGQWQLIEYYYANTHSSISVYRAWEDRVQPVSYQMTSHVGLGFAAVTLFFGAGIAAVLIGSVWRWLARR